MGQGGLFRIESERLKLPAPFSRRIAEPFDADATGQATFYCCFDIIEPPAASRDGADQPGPALKLLGPDVASRGVLREQYPARSFEWRLLPGNRKRPIIREVRCFVRVI